MHNHFMCVCICLCPWRAELCIKGLAHGGNRLSGARETGGYRCQGTRTKIMSGGGRLSTLTQRQIQEKQTERKRESAPVRGRQAPHMLCMAQSHPMYSQLVKFPGKWRIFRGNRARFIYEGWQSTKSGDVSGRSCDFCKQHKANPIEGDQRHKQGSHIFLTWRQHPQIRG